MLQLKRFLLVFFCFHTTLLACSNSYELCSKKIRDANVITTTSVSVPLQNSKRVVFTLSKSQENVLKYDPFLSLYLIEDRSNFAFPFSFDIERTNSFACADSTMAIEGDISRHQFGLDRFALFSKVVSAPSLLLNNCCSLNGIVTSKGIIEKSFIKHFLETKDVYYSDLGFRLNPKSKEIVVESVNPFINPQIFEKNDKILEFDGKKLHDPRDFATKILFLKLNSKHTMKIERNKKIMLCEVCASTRYGGGFLSDTYLETLGVTFDASLRISGIKNNVYGLKKGDRLLQVDGKAVDSSDGVRSAYKPTSMHSLLFERSGFEFFVTIDSKNLK